MDEAYRLKEQQIKKRKRRDEKRKKGGPLYRLVILLEAVSIMGYCIVSTVITQADNAEKRKELEELKLKEQQLTAANEECARLLDDKNEMEYYERLAIETQGYAYPSERRFIDTSRN